ncbi:hypothetical protein A4X13_0g583 [Tilletia indica]|uniref:Leptomycin B resistance protein pmd1 n=1 Tax=Tilletia indica TaxID=43049 RepID=A0A177THD9_9BASI|nr:hypothetical protein A4X13_0g583 [Tilletia indica]
MPSSLGHGSSSYPPTSSRSDDPLSFSNIPASRNVLPPSAPSSQDHHSRNITSQDSTRRKKRQYLPGQIGSPPPNIPDVLGSTSTPTPLANVPVHERSAREQGESVLRRHSRDIIMERQKYQQEQEQQYYQYQQQQQQQQQPQQYQYQQAPPSSQGHSPTSYPPTSNRSNEPPQFSQDHDPAPRYNTLQRQSSTDSTRLGHTDEKAAMRAANEAYAGGSASPADSKKLEGSGKSEEDHRDTHSAHVSIETKDQPEPYRASMRDLFRYATGWNHFFNMCGITSACIAGASQPLMTIVFGNLTTSFLNYQASLIQGPEAIEAARAELQGKVNEDALLLVYIGLAMFAATYIYMATWVYSGEEITRRIREKYLAAILRQEIAYFDTLGAGEVTTRISSDIQLIQEGISDKIPMSVMFLATFVTGFVVAYVRSWKLALSMTSIIPCVMISGSVMNVFIAKLQQLELDHVAHGATLAEEAFGTVRTAKAFGIETRLVELYDEDNKRSTKTGFRKAIISGIGLGIFFFIIYSGYALAFYFGSKLIADGEIASGVVMNVIFSIFIGAFSMALLAPNMQALSYALGAGGKIFETIDREPMIDSSSNEGLQPQYCEGTLHLHRVDFSYPARRDVQVLSDFSLHIPKGKVTALVGASGSGKSTIVQLVERFYDPDAGAVLMDGVDVRNLNLRWMRTQIGLVSQEPTLFSTSIRENIEHGLTNSQYAGLPDDQRYDLVVQAAKMANAHEFIQQLPEGYDTMVGDRAILLSGGQKQRIAIARAIVKNPRILLLDEATSALDTASEGVVTEALEKASKGRTTITIAHRLSTIKNADKIVVMGKGRIIEQGTHDSLLANPDSAYSSLVSAQKIQANTETQLIYDDEDEVFIAAAKERVRRNSMTSRASSRLSLSSLILRKRREEEEEDESTEKRPGVGYLFYRLVKINREYLWTLYIPGIVCAFACGAVYPAFAILFGRALENFSKCSQPVGTNCPQPFRDSMRHEADLNALWFFLISIVATLAVAIQTHNLMAASSILSERLRKMLYQAYLRADVAFFDDESHSSGALTNNLADFAQKIQGLVGVTLGTIIQSFATLIVGFIIALAYGWKLSLVVIACTPLTLSAGFVRLQLVVLKDVKIKKAHEGAAQRACEAANSIRTVASLTREDQCLAIYKEELKEPGRVIRNTAFVSNVLYSISQALAFPVIALAFWYGSKLMMRGEYSSGSFFTILTSVVFGSIQAGNVFNFVPDMSNARAATEASLKMIDNVPDIDSDAMGGINLDDCQGHIKFENVHFRYPTRTYQKVLRGLSLEIRPGSFNAIVGASGCGKSTMIQLIERFYDPIAGSVEIDGHNVTDLNLSSIRKHMALVSQEPTLYHGSIGFNIRLGALDPDSVTLNQIRQACAQSNILDFIESLPDGFDTEVGGRSTSQLSGGQKQRIAIARALIRNPKILLLDEATSALDSTSERVVQDALDKAARGRTTIAIAHRLSSISKADRIFVLKDGVVAESGTHSALMRLGGIYAQLVSLQTLQDEDS